jgi:hypothetical protein
MPADGVTAREGDDDPIDGAGRPARAERRRCATEAGHLKEAKMEGRHFFSFLLLAAFLGCIAIAFSMNGCVERYQDIENPPRSLAWTRGCGSRASKACIVHLADRPSPLRRVQVPSEGEKVAPHGVGQKELDR